MDAINVINLTKYFGQLCAVNEISFSVRKGEIFGFLGPNGAGKTTTVRMLTGMTSPTGGSADILGYDIKRHSVEAKKHIGIVPEVSNLYEEYSAMDNLLFTGELYGISRKRRTENARKFLELFGLYEKRKEKVVKFSKGMKRQVVFSMALMHEPEVLFLDEPTSGLDVHSSRKIKEIITGLKERGVTIFLTTHQMEEANQLCDRIAIIDHGRIAAIDTPERLKGAIESIQSVEITFSGMMTTQKLADIPEVSKITGGGTSFRLYTGNPKVVIKEVFTLAGSQGLEILSINTLGPTLEDVFVKITEGGHR